MFLRGYLGVVLYQPFFHTFILHQDGSRNLSPSDKYGSNNSSPVNLFLHVRACMFIGHAFGYTQSVQYSE